MQTLWTQGTLRIAGREIREAERRWDEAQLNPDADVLDGIMAEQFVAVLMNAIYTKAEVLESYRSVNDVSLEHYRSEVDRINVHGDVAVVVGRSNWRGRIKRAKVNNHALYSRVYVKTGGRWRVSVSHITVMEA
jgi:ketosteroid isomerase-like protein